LAVLAIFGSQFFVESPIRSPITAFFGNGTLDRHGTSQSFTE